MTIVERVIPLLVYKDIQAAHDFLVGAFGFEPGRVDSGPDGRPVHGEVFFGGTEIWLHRVTSEHGTAAPGAAEMAGAGLVIHVADVDDHCARARQAGAHIESEPTDQSYGQREYEARDPEGHRWWFATPTPAD